MAEQTKGLLEEFTTVVPTGGIQELGELPSLYINNVEMSFTAFDVRLILGENLGPDEGALRIKRRVKVFMSLEHAKAFAALLSGGIRQFESVAGQEIQFFNLTEQTEGAQTPKAE